jgi:hypothetical protein
MASPTVRELIGRSGNVGTGARDMLEALGVEWIHPDQLSSVADSSKVSSSSEESS